MILLRNRRALRLALVGSVFFLFCAVTSRVQADDIFLDPYSIPDQFDDAHTADEVQDSVVVYLRSDRKSFKYSPEWTQAINAELVEVPGSADVTFVYLAHMKGVPSFLRSVIKKKFPQDRAHWMLLDWKGVFASSYGFTKGAVDVLIFDRKGLLVYQSAVTEVEQSKLSEMIVVMRAALEATAENVD